MSAYAEWKHGLITYDQYRASYCREIAEDKDYNDSFIWQQDDDIDEMDDEDKYDIEDFNE